MLALIQFDATGVPLLERMLAEGRLPALAGLVESGHWRALEAATDLFELSTYPTLYTGLELGEHGLYSSLQWSAKEQRLRTMHSFPRPPAVVETLAEAGRRSLVLDPYQLWRPRSARGAALSGWQFAQKMIPEWSAPKRTRRELARRFGAASLLDDAYGRRTDQRLQGLRKTLLAAPARAADAVEHLMAEEAFDLVWVNLLAAHQAGHHFWDPAFAAADPTGEASDRTLPEVYAACDLALGRMVAALPPGADVLVFSPLGMGVNTSRSDFLPGMLSTVLGGGARSKEQTKDGPGGSVWRVRGAVPRRLRAAVARALPGPVVRGVLARLYLRGIDWTRTRAVALPGDHFGYVRLNVRSREREGIVDPSAVDELSEEIAAGLTSFRDPDGSPAVAAVERVAEHVHGPRAGQLPDLVVRWSDRSSVDLTGLSSPVFGDIARSGVGSGWTGNHHEGAWALVVPGSSRPVDLDRAPQIADIAATVRAAVGLETDWQAGEPLLERG